MFHLGLRNLQKLQISRRKKITTTFSEASESVPSSSSSSACHACTCQPSGHPKTSWKLMMFSLENSEKRENLGNSAHVWLLSLSLSLFLIRFATFLNLAKKWFLFPKPTPLSPKYASVLWRVNWHYFAFCQGQLIVCPHVTPSPLLQLVMLIFWRQKSFD